MITEFDFTVFNIFWISAVKRVYPISFNYCDDLLEFRKSSDDISAPTGKYEHVRQTLIPCRNFVNKVLGGGSVAREE